MSKRPAVGPARLFAAAVVLLVCLAAFWWRLGSLGLIDPDEPFYAKSAREMLHAGDWVVPRIFDHPQFEKPPVVYWLLMASARALGPTELAGRLPAALFATALTFLTFAFGVRVLGFRAGFLAAIVLATGVEFLVTARMILTDMIFATFLAGSVFALWFAGRDEANRARWFAVACAASGAAALTKGPLGILIPGFAIVALFLSGANPFPRRRGAILLGAGLFLAIAVPWYAVMIHRFGMEYVRSFFVHENVDRLFVAEHPSNNRVYYYGLVLLLGSIPWLPLLPALARRAWRGAREGGIARYLGVWLVLSVAFFTLAASKLPTYVLFAFVPVALFAGLALDRMIEGVDGAGWEWPAALALALAQAVTLFGATRLPVVAPFALPATVIAAFLLLAALLLALRRWRAWVGASALAGLAIPVACLGLGGPGVDAMVSVRPLAAAIERDDAPADTVLASPILARGVAYYTGRPVAVLTNRPSPFFTPHPLRIVLGTEGLAQYLTAHDGGVACAVSREWGRLARGLPDTTRWSATPSGEKLLVLAGAKDPAR
ncbi:MAG: ArnT family glycosyltransferase [Hyphomicrobiales bacterium]